jgi:hypothetical protein
MKLALVWVFVLGCVIEFLSLAIDPSLFGSFSKFLGATVASFFLAAFVVALFWSKSGPPEIRKK